MLLIDADSMAFRAGFATEKTIYLVDNENQGFAEFADAKTAKAYGGIVWSRKELKPVEEAVMILDTMIRDILDRYPDHKAEFFLSGVGNFRHGIATRANYKGNRAGSVPPTHLKALRTHLETKWNAKKSFMQEADDDISIRATEVPGSVIASVDKDFKQIPGIFYDFSNKEEFVISKREADLNFWEQVITGDTADNVPGLTGLGPVKAKKALAGAKGNKACWKLIVELYEKEFSELGPKYAVETAQLVYLRRSPGEMWNPPW